MRISSHRSGSSVSVSRRPSRRGPHAVIRSVTSDRRSGSTRSTSWPGRASTSSAAHSTSCGGRRAATRSRHAARSGPASSSRPSSSRARPRSRSHTRPTRAPMPYRSARNSSSHSAKSSSRRHPPTSTTTGTGRPGSSRARATSVPARSSSSVVLPAPGSPTTTNGTRSRVGRRGPTRGTTPSFSRTCSASDPSSPSRTNRSTPSSADARLAGCAGRRARSRARSGSHAARHAVTAASTASAGHSQAAHGPSTRGAVPPVAVLTAIGTSTRQVTLPAPIRATRRDARASRRVSMSRTTVTALGTRW
ncbi:hypothetical protein K7G98_07060 [Saccharothrix sp. MB29]|nr:hypothetical protein [Saccharothrix sp. MB29]